MTTLLTFHWSKLTISCVVPLAYLCLVRFLRWRRYNALHRKYCAKFSAGTLTPQDAQNIIYLSVFYDMPGIINYSLSFALFKTYAIPSISKILAATKELKSKELISKRYADTEILITTWVACPISGHFDLSEKSGQAELDPRAMLAVARVNWLHSRYKISNDDYLFTLSLFIFEPVVWAKRYGWRPLSRLESHAYFIFWREIGKRMNIENIPETAEEFKQWSDDYAVRCMVPAQSNHDVAGYTTDELLHIVPEKFGIKQFFRNVSTCLLEDRVRIAMMRPEQPWYLHALTRSVMLSVKFTHHYLSLPRWKPLSLVDTGMPKTSDGSLPRLYPTRWQAKPWYKPQSKGIGSLLDRFAVLIGFYDDLPGPKYKCEGYRLEEVGPTPAENSGHEEVMRNAGELLGCPITGPWSLKGGE